MKTGSRRSSAMRWTLLPLAIVLLILPQLIGIDYYLHVAIVSLVFIILAVSLDLLVGYCGLLSLGHTAFFAFGAYAAALLYLHLNAPLWITLFASGAFAALIAWFLGLLVLGVRGHRFVITTIVFAEIGRLIAYNWTDVTHGQVGLPGIRPPVFSIPGLVEIDFASRAAYYYLALAITAVCVIAMWRIAHSPIGWRMVALRENERLTEASGIDTRRIATTAFVVSAFFAGVAGSLYAHYTGFVSPDLFYFTYTTTMLIMVFLGGKGTIVGPIVGAVLFTILPEALRVAADFRLMIFSAILLALVVFAPEGLAGLFNRLTARRRGLVMQPSSAVK
ncbi:MAG: branched-chain amino acid ABC transporter permease [Methylobacteriaceae bacterium]|nr:branched-chain amino acid ABC transporter permease [Methylobacteriaceae bacterium]